MATSDIDPTFITTGNVSKSIMRAQLQYIKDSLLALEALVYWKRISTVSLVSPTAAFVLPLPDGYNRYRIEFNDWRGVSDGILQCRMSSDGTAIYSTAGDYDGPVLDWNATGVASAGIGSTEMTIAASQGSAKPGASGRIEMPYLRNQGTFDCGYMKSDNVRQRRSGSFGTTGTNNKGIQFFVSGGSINMAIGCQFTLLARA